MVQYVRQSANFDVAKNLEVPIYVVVVRIVVKLECSFTIFPKKRKAPFILEHVIKCWGNTPAFNIWIECYNFPSSAKLVIMGIKLLANKLTNWFEIHRVS